MARKPRPTFRDSLVGSIKSVFNGTGMSPVQNYRFAKEEMYRRLEKEGRQAEATARNLGLRALPKSHLTEISRHAYQASRAQQGRDLLQDIDGYKVKSKGGYSRQYGQFTTDIIITDPKSPGEHYHFVVGDDGTVIQDGYRSDH